MIVDYIKLKRTTKNFTQLAGTAIKAGEPIVINNLNEGQYLIIGGDTDGNVSSSTKVVKFLDKTKADNYIYWEKDGNNYNLKEPVNNLQMKLVNSTTGQAGSVAQSLTFKDDGSGEVPGADGNFNGSVARDISYNSIGALPVAALSSSATNTSYKVFYADSTAPTNTGLLWIDTTPGSTNGGLKYYNGSAWVHVPVAYT